MGWITVENFEGGNYGSGWSGDTDVMPVISTSQMEGSYAISIDTSAGNYSSNTDILVINSQSISRNDIGDKTVRALVYNRYGGKEDKPTSLIFFVQDSLSYYIVKLSTDYGDSDQKIMLSKVVDGVETELASYEYSEGGHQGIYGIEVKSETNLITVYWYKDKTFTTPEPTTITSSDTEFLSGGMGFCINTDTSSGNGIKSSEFLADSLQLWYDESSNATIQGINSIMGVQNITI